MSDELASVEPDGPLYRLGRQPSPTDEELGVFDRDADPGVRLSGKQSFAEWYWGATF
jgi:hypothetical protein